MLGRCNCHSKEYGPLTILPAFWRRIPSGLLKTGSGLTLLAALLLLAHEIPVTRMILGLITGWRSRPEAPLLFLALGIPYSLLGLPRQGLCLAAGLVFGTFAGLGLATVATLGGNVIGFLWVRRLASPAQRQTLQARFRGRLALIGHILNASPFQAVLTLRLMPVGSALMVTAAAGLYGVPLMAFTWATLFGALPQNLVFVLVGAGAQLGHTVQIVLGLILFVGSAVLGLYLLHKAKRDDGALGALTRSATSETGHDKPGQIEKRD